MPGVNSSTFMLDVPEVGTITAKVDSPTTDAPPICGAPALILAHGANNDLDYPLLAYLAEGLAAKISATVLRFNFPYVERGAEHTSDSADTLLRAFQQAYLHIVGLTSTSDGPTSAAHTSDTPIFVGGKSLGGRTAAELVSRLPEGNGAQAAGLIELGYPLHAPGRKDRINVKPLRHIDVPSLFCVGSRDAFCDLGLLKPVLPTLLGPVELYVVEGGDHSLLLPKSSGKKPDAAYPEVLAKIAGFLTSV